MDEFEKDLLKLGLVVVSSQPLPYFNLEPDKARVCLGRESIPFTNGEGVMSGPFIYADQIRINGEKVDDKRLSIGSQWQLCLDGKVLPEYDRVKEDGTVVHVKYK
jgi:hypothetical protein